MMRPRSLGSAQTFSRLSAGVLPPGCNRQHFPQGRIQGLEAVSLDRAPADAEGCAVHQRLQRGSRLLQGLFQQVTLGHVVGQHQFPFTAVLFEAESLDLGEQKAAVLAPMAPDPRVVKAISPARLPRSATRELLPADGCPAGSCPEILLARTRRCAPRPHSPR